MVKCYVLGTPLSINDGRQTGLTMQVCFVFMFMHVAARDMTMCDYNYSALIMTIFTHNNNHCNNNDVI